MSDNPVFDTVQALYPDVEIPDLLQDSEVIRGYGQEPDLYHRRILPPPVPRNMDELVADAKKLLAKPLPTSQIVVNSDFPQHVTDSMLRTNKQLLRGRHGQA